MHTWQVILLCLWLVYFLSPIDLVPDVFPVLGWLDDLLVLAGGYWFITRLRAYAMAGAASGRSSASAGSNRTSSGNNEEQDDASGAAGSTAPADPWQVLQLMPGASTEEIAAAYKAQLLKYHPDRVAHLGEEFQHLAHRKTLEIQRAYAQLNCRTP